MRQSVPMTTAAADNDAGRPAGTARRILRGVAAGALGLLLLGVAARETNTLRRYRHGPLSRGTAYSADVPPMLRFATVALGGFRGMIADVLWLRAASMQEEGRFVELVQLSEWITALEPDNGEVWAYHAWNLAYNVSVMMRRPEDRWRWVQNGIDLLRDNGVRLNPSNAQVRRELAWFFQHKLGTDTDTAAPYYRREWARTIASYLEPDGAPPEADSLNAAELTEALGLDPAKMRAIDHRFGRLDWRVPCSQAVYWGLEALERATERERLGCRRVVYQSLILMIQGDGRLVGDPDDEDFVFRAVPNEDLLVGSLAFLEETLRAHEFQGVRTAFAGLLLEGVRIDARQGRDSAARAKYARAAPLFGDASALPPYDDYVAGRGEVDWTQFRGGD